MSVTFDFHLKLEADQLWTYKCPLGGTEYTAFQLSSSLGSEQGSQGLASYLIFVHLQGEARGKLQTSYNQNYWQFYGEKAVTSGAHFDDGRNRIENITYIRPI